MTEEIEKFDEPTTNEASEIKRISKDNVLKICSAQVILNLGIGVKELLENSVDAGATVIEIKIKEYGLEGFEVVDNGIGVLESDFEGITAKHHTSKLKEFNDLETIKTLGFRGEALSALCSLSDVTIFTRHKSATFGTFIEYGNDGKIINKSNKARNIGTTVSVKNFFKTLPVRKTEFQKNYRREYNKMIQLLQEYCLVLIGVKIICTNQTKNGTKQTVLTTAGLSINDNITSIFGVKQSQEIIKMKLPTNDGTENGFYTQESLLDISSSIDLKEKDIETLNSMKFRIEGFISDIDHKCGRTTKDRQFTYVNSRPVELKTALKTINEVYQIYNLKQYPFVFINFMLDQSCIDVNLSKDKRQVAIVNDTAVQVVLKKSLLETFGELPTKFKLSSVNSVMKKFSNDSEENEDSSEDEDDKIMVIEPNSNFAASLKQWKISPHAPFPKMSKATSSKRKLESSESSQLEKLQKIDSFMLKMPNDEDSYNENDTFVNTSLVETSEKISLIEPSTSSVNANISKILNRTSSIESIDEEYLSHIGRTSTQKGMDDISFNIDCKPASDQNSTLKLEIIKPQTSINTLTEQINDEEESNNETNVNDTYSPPKNFNLTDTIENLEYDTPKLNETFNHKISITLDQIKTNALEEEEIFQNLKKSSANKSFKLKFKESLDPSKNKKAEMELETELKKDMFKNMKVIGQFNLGFIIAKLDDDLFVIDQHATDERYNFEMLKKSLIIDSQKMVNPEQLELTAIQEDTIIQNLDIFEMNGFKFEYNEHALPTKRIKLISRPYFENWEFGKEDVEEMIFMLQDAPKIHCRPSRIIKMLASKACRKSVMIGTALDHKQMKVLLEHMGDMVHPWNCPHNRPTIRFLHNLSMIDQTNGKCLNS
ncbi:hypothetical protein PVAND_010248 [Polypedilum vanderplanki]|uniref:Mismatch repair endonuclease PMS2 n=1 Tax=Polypedilum vanderplanki TaxID=319348 RepID=A0A9J6CF01_POLVA|nr:hypothetical protein PVAND_010248 [Polypedilum vanderplanki]